MVERILVVSNSTSGLVSFRTELLETLCKEYEVIILSADTGRTEILEGLGCKIIATNFDRHGMNPLKELQLYSFYKKKIKEIQPKIVLTYTIKPNIYAGAACAALKVPYLVNITGLGTAVENGGILQRITIPMYRFGIRKAQKVFFQNRENRDFMLAHKMVREGQYELIPGSGVNIKKYTPSPYPNGDTVDFVFISRVMREKGIDQYLDAARVIREKHHEVRFHVCGDCEQDYEEQLNKLHEEGVIIYHGRINDIAGMHRICGCTVHPSFYPEGMSNVLLEACACARPIITTDRAGCREIVEDGKNGYIVKQRDSSDLIEKIEMFLSLSWDQRKNMGLAARAKVEKEFDRQIVIRRYMEELRIING